MLAHVIFPLINCESLDTVTLLGARFTSLVGLDRLDHSRMFSEHVVGPQTKTNKHMYSIGHACCDVFESCDARKAPYTALGSVT